MKRKFLILTLCFTLIFSSINFNKSYADAGVISAPMLATLLVTATACGVIINNTDDLYDLGRSFYEYHREKWDLVQTVFNSSVKLLGDGMVSVGNEFKELISECIDFYGSMCGSSVSVALPFNYESIIINPDFANHIDVPTYYNFNSKIRLSFGDGYFAVQLYINGVWESINSVSIANSTLHKSCNYYLGTDLDGKYYLYYRWSPTGSLKKVALDVRYYDYIESALVSLPNLGSYDDTILDDYSNEGSISIPMPGDISDLVGNTSSGVLNGDYSSGLSSGVVSFPSVDNPSISVDNSISFPNTDVDVPDVDVPDVDVPGTDTIVPSFPSFGDSLDFSPMYLTNVTEKFPFSLPWDIGRLIQKFDVDPIAPIFDVPILSETITLDLTEFDELAAIVRFFVLICFILSLIFISTKLLG